MTLKCSIEAEFEDESNTRLLSHNSKDRTTLRTTQAIQRISHRLSNLALDKPNENIPRRRSPIPDTSQSLIRNSGPGITPIGAISWPPLQYISLSNEVPSYSCNAVPGITPTVDLSWPPPLSSTNEDTVSRQLSKSRQGMTPTIPRSQLSTEIALHISIPTRDSASIRSVPFTTEPIPDQKLKQQRKVESRIHQDLEDKTNSNRFSALPRSLFPIFNDRHPTNPKNTTRSDTSPELFLLSPSLYKDADDSAKYLQVDTDANASMSSYLLPTVKGRGNLCNNSTLTSISPLRTTSRHRLTSVLNSPYILVLIFTVLYQIMHCYH